MESRIQLSVLFHVELENKTLSFGELGFSKISGDKLPGIVLVSVRLYCESIV